MRFLELHRTPRADYTGDGLYDKCCGTACFLYVFHTVLSVHRVFREQHNEAHDRFNAGLERALYFLHRLRRS